MKFTKFIKTLASDGIIYEKGVLKERWLASASVFMKIPDGTQSVTATSICEMPKAIAKMIDRIGHTEEAELYQAVMPVPNGGIKDCVRVFKARNSKLFINISNDDWSLIEKADFCEILYTYNLDNDTTEAKALLVKNYPAAPDDDDELVGIIFPITYEI